jgi:hypothetical protein
METFYCVGCRSAYAIEKAARLTPAAHRDGESVGFCFLCVREVQTVESAALVIGDEFEDDVDDAPDDDDLDEVESGVVSA